MTAAAAALLLLAVSLVLWAGGYVLASCYTALGCIASLGIAVMHLGLEKYRSPARFVLVLKVAAIMLVVCGIALVVLGGVGAYALLFMR